MFCKPYTRKIYGKRLGTEEGFVTDDLQLQKNKWRKRGTSAQHVNPLKPEDHLTILESSVISRQAQSTSIVRIKWLMSKEIVAVY
jgi:hypothetical protein